MPVREEQYPTISLGLTHAGWRKIVDPLVGRRIRELRDEAGSNLGDIARPLGLRIKSLKAIENGKAPANGTLLHALGGIFSVPVEFFFEGLPAAVNKPALAKPSDDTNRAPKARELVRLLNTYSSLPDEALRKSLIDLVEAMRKANPAN